MINVYRYKVFLTLNGRPLKKKFSLKYFKQKQLHNVFKKGVCTDQAPSIPNLVSLSFMLRDVLHASLRRDFDFNFFRFNYCNIDYFGAFKPDIKLKYLSRDY